MERRVNKYIGDSGFCSRREADRLVESGKVTINGVVAQMGSKVCPGDQVKVAGKAIRTSQKRVYIALNKPVGIVSTTDPSEPNNIADFVGYPSRIFNIGRLDKPSEGLILLTNDGDIVNKVLRAANNHQKEYLVNVDRPINDEFIKRMSSGIPILDTVTLPCEVEKLSKMRFRIILTQGLNRQIRRMCEYLGYEVTKLKRTRIMNIELGKLPVGQWRLLTNHEMETLNRSLAHSDGTEKASQISASEKPLKSREGAKKNAPKIHTPKRANTTQWNKSKSPRKNSSQKGVTFKKK